MVELADGEEREYEKFSVKENGWLKAFNPVDEEPEGDERIIDYYPPDAVARVRQEREPPTLNRRSGSGVGVF